MNFKNVKVPKVPGSGAAGAVVRAVVLGGAVIYAGLNSLYNVEGGHRAIVFNRIQGIKDKVGGATRRTDTLVPFGASTTS